MAISTGSIQSPSPSADTHGPDTGLVRTIRADIEPRTGFWQFEFKPWHYWTAIGSAAVTAGAFVSLLLTLGHLR